MRLAKALLLSVFASVTVARAIPGDIFVSSDGGSDNNGGDGEDGVGGHDSSGGDGGSGNSQISNDGQIQTGDNGRVQANDGSGDNDNGGKGDDTSAPACKRAGSLCTGGGDPSKGQYVSMTAKDTQRMVDLLGTAKASDDSDSARAELFDMFESLVVNAPDINHEFPQIFYIDGAWTGGEVQVQDQGLMTVGKMFGGYGVGVFGQYKPQSAADIAAGKPKETQEPFNSIVTAGKKQEMFDLTSDFYAAWFARHPPADGKPRGALLAYYSHQMGTDFVESWANAKASDGKSPSIWNRVELPTLQKNKYIDNVYLVDANVASVWTSYTSPTIQLVLNEGDLDKPVPSGDLPVQLIAHGGASGGDIINTDP